MAPASTLALRPADKVRPTGPIPHLEALEVLRAVTRADPPVSERPNELDAVLTHWLHRPTERPRFGRPQHRTDWARALGFESPDKVRVSYSDADGPLAYAKPRASLFTFVDLFAGIGGFRLGLQAVGGDCLFSSEWDAAAKATYFANFGEVPFGDIRQFTGSRANLDQIPDHDVLAAGFPCQPFSRAGVSARRSLGLKEGFECETQGTLFFEIERIVEAKSPRILLLENVKNLLRHDGGRTFSVIERTIRRLGYSFAYALINAENLVPQRRVRCFMVCIRGTRAFKFEMSDFEGEAKRLGDYLEQDVADVYTISDRLWQGHIDRTRRNLKRGTGFTAFVADLEKPAGTLVARYGKDGKECLIPQPGKNPRLLTPRECANLQGFPSDFRLPRFRSAAYRQFGNSVAVPVVQRIAERMVEYL